MDEDELNKVLRMMRIARNYTNTLKRFGSRVEFLLQWMDLDRELHRLMVDNLPLDDFKSELVAFIQNCKEEIAYLQMCNKSSSDSSDSD